MRARYCHPAVILRGSEHQSANRARSSRESSVPCSRKTNGRPAGGLVAIWSPRVREVRHVVPRRQSPRKFAHDTNTGRDRMRTKHSRSAHHGPASALDPLRDIRTGFPRRANPLKSGCSATVRMRAAPPRSRCETQGYSFAKSVGTNLPTRCITAALDERFGRVKSCQRHRVAVARRFFGFGRWRGCADPVISDRWLTIRGYIRARLFDSRELQGLRKPATPMSRAETGAAHHRARSGAV
jgi:hypothetical protein